MATFIPNKTYKFIKNPPDTDLWNEGDRFQVHSITSGGHAMTTDRVRYFVHRNHLENGHCIPVDHDNEINLEPGTKLQAVRLRDGSVIRCGNDGMEIIRIQGHGLWAYCIDENGDTNLVRLDDVMMLALKEK